MDITGNAEQALRMVREAKDLVYDTETSGLDWKRHSPIGYVVGAIDSAAGATESTVYIPVRHGGGGNIEGGAPLRAADGPLIPHPFERELAKAFADRNRGTTFGRIVGHNTKFDCHFSANAGILLGRRMACTQNMAALLDEYAKSYNLEVVAERLKVQPKKSQELYDRIASTFGIPATKDTMARLWEMPGNDPVVAEYATGDGATTAAVYLEQLKQIAEEDLSVVADLENDLLWTIFRMERTGIKIDLGAVDDLKRSIEDKVTQLLSQFPPGFNTRSPLAMKSIMEQNGHTDWPVTEIGNPSFTEKWLKKNDVGKAIVEIRQMSNLSNSFVGPLASKHVYRGRVHATLNQLRNDEKGTISGRFSCSDPNLQQVPKHNKAIAKPYRKLFVADEGWVFWERDYSQAEPRLFAHYSGDENLTRGYNSQPFVDAHTTVAKMLGVERDPTAKRMNMGIFTGMQPHTFAEHMGWPLAEATDKWHAWFAAFPGVRAFQKNAKSRLAARGYVFTLLGRRCRLENRQWAYKGTSKIIQGGSADILKWKLLEMDRLCEDNGDIVRVLMTVHDSFNGQFQDTPEARALFEEVVRIMSDVQSEPFNLAVPFLAEGHEGPNWCVASFGDK
jgi:DNA polymerase I-like protein with 3'-5' exonuclease and polymerase domains